jgi:hypothetical protein
MRQGLGLQLRPGRDRRPENDHAAEDDDNRQNTKSAFSFGADHAPKNRTAAFPLRGMPPLEKCEFN